MSKFIEYNLLEEHIKILKQANENKLPNKVDCNSDISLNFFKDLYENKFIKAIDASSLSGSCYLQPEITLKGRAYLVYKTKNSSTKSNKKNSVFSWRTKFFLYLLGKLDHAVTVIITVVLTYGITKYFNL